MERCGSLCSICARCVLRSFMLTLRYVMLLGNLCLKIRLFAGYIVVKPKLWNRLRALDV